MDYQILTIITTLPIAFAFALIPLCALAWLLHKLQPVGLWLKWLYHSTLSYGYRMLGKLLDSLINCIDTQNKQQKG